MNELPTDYDQHVSTMTILRTYASNSNTRKPAIAITTDLAKLEADGYTPTIEAFLTRVGERLGLPPHPIMPNGMYYGLHTEGTRSFFLLAPFTDRRTEQQLRVAFQAEIDEAKARIKAKPAAHADITGGVDAAVPTLQAVMNLRSNEPVRSA